MPLWLDAGIASVRAARRALELAAAVVVVGLETMPSYDALAEICAWAGGDRVAFSLDLRDGEPVVAPGIPSEPAHIVAARAAAAGAGAVIVIDLARVGTGTGLDLALVARVRKEVPGLTLLAGGLILTSTAAMAGSKEADTRPMASSIVSKKEWGRTPAGEADARRPRRER